jgi:uncharacterized protein (TIGR00369 family)
MAGRNLEILRQWIDGTLPTDHAPDGILMPPPITNAIPFRITSIGEGTGVMEIDADAATLANPMGTVHGGVFCTIADAAIGMTHWASLGDGDTFTSVDFRINFFRPVWRNHLVATARVVHAGRTVSYYECDITREDGKLVAHATSTVMTLRGEAATGR